MGRIDSGGHEAGPSRLFKDTVEEGIRTAVGRVSQRFEGWPYHRTEHTEAVVARTQLILATIREADPSSVSERDYLLGQLAAAFHDTVQDFDLVTTPDGRTMMKRATGVNEERSAREAENFMLLANTSAGTEIFTYKDIEAVCGAIMTTVPSWNPEHKTVVQSGLTSESTVVARAVALADIGIAGLDPQNAVEEGDRVFMEENVDIITALGNLSSLTEQQKDSFRVRMAVWSDAQVEYFKGRQSMFEAEIDGLSEPAKQALRVLFGGFAESIRRQSVVANTRRSMSFEDIARDMGYDLR